MRLDFKSDGGSKKGMPNGTKASGRRKVDNRDTKRGVSMYPLN